MSASKVRKKKLVMLKESSIAEIQELLQEEAKNGWFFVEKKAFIYYFEKRKSRNLKFRLLPNDEKPLDKEIERYKQDGWEYVDNLSRVAIFCGKPSADEIKLQPKKTAETINRLQSEIYFQIGFAVLITLLAIISWIVITFSDGFFWKNIADNWNSNFSIPLIYSVLIIISVMLIVDKVDLFNAFKKLPIVDRGNKSKKESLLITRIVFIVILSVFAIVVFIMTILSMLSGVNSRDILKFEGDNMIALMDVEEIEEYYTRKQYENLGLVKSVNTTPIYEGVYSEASTMICKQHLSWRETLFNENEKYSASMNGEFYNMINIKLAKKIYNEIVQDTKKALKKDSAFADIIPKKKYKQFKHFDNIFVMKQAGKYNVVVRKGKEVFSIEFSGKNGYVEVLNYIENNYSKREIEKRMS